MDFTQTAHRPFSMPTCPYAVRMTWHDLLFMHWPVNVDELARHVPPGLAIDRHDGDAWIGLVPFRMTGVSHRRLPNLPWVSAFPELNVRTYVTAGGTPGVLFLSLDASNPIAVSVARWVYGLPYHLARMSCAAPNGWIEYASSRLRGGAEFAARYRPIGEPFAAKPGSVEHFLIERYCLFTAGRDGTIRRGDIHHVPWPLQRAECEVDADTMTRPLAIRREGKPALVHFARRIEAVAWKRGPSPQQK